jgi:hypothetical protein
MAVEVFSNDGQGTVSSGGTTAPSPGAGEVWTVSVSVPFPTASSSATPPTQFYVCDPAAETEKILVTNVSGSTWTVTRGADGSTPVAHTAGFTIVQVLTGASLRALQNGLNVVPPSGGDDTSALQAAINAAATAGQGAIFLLPGVYRISAPLTIDSNNIAITGAGQHATTISCIAGSAITAMLEVGSSQIVQYITVSGLQIFGNAFSGHNVIWRASSSVIRDVVLQNPPGDCLHIDPSTLGGEANQCVFDNVQGITPGGDGVYTDGHLFDSDFIAGWFDGGTNPSTPGGGTGLIINGANIRVHGTHAYLFAGGGASVTGTDIAFFGAELESNAVADLIINNAHLCSFVGVALYDHANPSPPSQHIHVTGNSSNIDIASCMQGVDTYSVPSFIVVDSGSRAKVHDCPGYNPVGALTAPTYTSGTATTNTFPVRCRVFVAGSTAVAVNGTATGLATGTFELVPGETITPTGASGSWTWFGL